MTAAADDFESIRAKMDPDVFLVGVGANKVTPSSYAPPSEWAYGSRAAQHIRDMYVGIMDTSSSHSLLEHPQMLVLVQWAGYRVHIKREEGVKPIVELFYMDNAFNPPKEKRYHSAYLSAEGSAKKK